MLAHQSQHRAAFQKLLIGVAAALILSAGSKATEIVSGEPRIVKIRFAGIDAPETDQVCLDANGKHWACGIAAREPLAAYSASRQWECDIRGNDKYWKNGGWVWPPPVRGFRSDRRCCRYVRSLAASRNLANRRAALDQRGDQGSQFQSVRKYGPEYGPPKSQLPETLNDKGFFGLYGGESGIRTHGTAVLRLAPWPVLNRPLKLVEMVRRME
jgi:hypothetical protein